MKIQIFIAIFCWPLFAPAQKTHESRSEGGIKWTTGLSWEQVKQKAQKENKYIFLDYYATWCAPCKQMDQQVFISEDVGNYFNGNFISIKVQSDKTKNDDSNIKAWYTNAESFQKKYKIRAFPTLLFFTPKGTMVQLVTGYKSGFDLIKEGKTAIILKQYVNPYKEYDAFVEAYEKGKKNYSAMPEMIETAWKVGQHDIYDKFSIDYLNYMSGLTMEKWYSKRTIEFLASSPMVGSMSTFFKLFYPDGSKIDALMQKDGFARKKVDRVIEDELSNPFLKNFYEGKSLNKLLEKDPSWDSLHRIIFNKYSDEDLAIGGVLIAKCNYYRYVDSIPAYITTFVARMQRNDIDMDPTNLTNIALINECAWYIFQRSLNKDELDLAAKWMKELTTMKFSKDVYLDLLYDTYANLMYKSSLLFKVGLFDEALAYEKKALQIAILRGNEEYIKSYQRVIDKMTQKEHTW